MGRSREEGIGEASVRRLAARILGTAPGGTVTRIPWSEGGGYYDVWRLEDAGRAWILKRVTAEAAAFYRAAGPPAALASCRGETGYYGKTYLLLDCFPGRELTGGTRAELTCALDALVSLQSEYWERAAIPGEAFDTLRKRAARRRACLHDGTLERAFDVFLSLYDSLPRTLVHEDLLPFNVLTDGTRAVLIDWECGGCGPYPLPLARLLAHTSPDPAADFPMSEEDREYAAARYYDTLLRGRGIPWEEYRRALTAFFFFEHTEWIYVHEKYGTPPDDARYLADLRQAKALARRLLG